MVETNTTEVVNLAIKNTLEKSVQCFVQCISNVIQNQISCSNW